MEFELEPDASAGCGVVGTAVVVLDSGVSCASAPSSSSSFLGPEAVVVAVAVVVMVSVPDANDAVDGVGVGGVLVMMGMTGVEGAS